MGVLGAAMATGVLGGLIAGAILALLVAVVNDWSFGADALLLSGYLAGLYAAVFCLGLLVAALGMLAMGGRPGPRVFWALLLGFSVFVTAVLRFSPAIQLFSVVPSMNLLGVVDLVVIAVASLAVTGAVLSTQRIRVMGASALAIALLAGLGLFHRWHEAPRRLDLAAEIPPLAAAAAPVAPAPAGERLDGVKLFVLALDGLSWNVTVPMMKAGDMPNLAALLDGAAYGYLETLRFTVSPVVWETIVTSQPERRHGIGHHFHFAFPGLSRHVNHLPNMPLCNTPMGLRRLLSATRGLGLWANAPASSEDARVARLWEILSRGGLDVGVFMMLNTTPAAPIRGWMHGHGVFHPTDYPDDLEAGFPPMPPRPKHGATAGIGWEKEKEPIERALWQRFTDLALRDRPDVLMYYTHFGDGVNHVNWKVETIGDDVFYSGLHGEAFTPGPASTAVNRFLDSLIGDAMARLPDDALFVVVSDHGFDFRGYEHDNSPPGTLIVRGPGIRPGPIEGASIYDVTPTLIHWLGLPVADDMEGEVLSLAIPGGRFDREVARIATWGAASKTSEVGDVEAEDLKEHEEYLRSLGYVVD